MTLFDPRARVEIDGEMFDSFLHTSLISAVQVELSTNQASQVELTVVDKDHKFIDAYARKNGLALATVYVWLGFGDGLGEPVFEGFLTGVGHEGNKSTLSFHDRSQAMRLEQKTGYHKGLDIDVIKKLAARNGLGFDGPGKGVEGLPLKSKMQEALTDWDFAMQLAEEAGLVLYVRGKTLFAKPPARTGSPALTFGRRDAMMLSAHFDYKTPENQEGRPGQVEVRGRGRGGSRLSGVSDKNQRGTKQVVLNQTIKHASTTEAARRAQAKKELEREPAFTGRIRSLLQTNARADVRQTIEMVDHGLIFSGKYLIDSLGYDFAPGRLTTEYDVRRDINDAGRF